jgi:hypothetical protein
MKTTNYYNTFIQVAADCPVKKAEVPARKNGEPTVATRQFDLIYDHPYQYTSDDVLFRTSALKNNVSPAELDQARAVFFAKGQPCFRASPLTKRYGWGVHSNAEGKMAIYAVESDEYLALSKDSNLKVVNAMRLKRA